MKEKGKAFLELIQETLKEFGEDKAPMLAAADDYS